MLLLETSIRPSQDLQ